MVSSLSHRGPDDRGSEIYSGGKAQVGLGHSRLSVLDVSSAGHQPMYFKHLGIVLNGEIYNFKEIRMELTGMGHQFVSESDTEVVLHAFHEWGKEAVSRFIGMFAFAIHDSKQQTITFVRDRAGVKPFYYYWKNGLFLFASELKAFHQHPGFKKELDSRAAHLYMDFGYVPSPYTIFRDCHKLEPGHMLNLDLVNRKTETTLYWDVRQFYMKPVLDISYEEALGELELIFISAFNYRMVSDVPVGVFLSGGYDSTAVTSILQSGMTDKLRTFTIGFEEGNNEAPEAQKIASYLGTDHTEYICTTSEAQQIIPSLQFSFDEPFADPSAIPTILVSQLARKSVTVALSADAGDELFAGYVNHATFMRNMELVDRIPGGLKSPMAHFSGWLAGAFAEDIPFRMKLQTLSRVLKADDVKVPQTLLRSYVNLGEKTRNGLFRDQENHLATIFDEDLTRVRDRLSMALAIDYNLYLQNDIMTKVDRATMSVALEGREPLLDHRILEFAARLPSEYKYGSTQKRILKEIVHRYIPREMMDRPKAGFSIPLESWLRGELSYLLEEYFEKNLIIQSGLFNPEYAIALKRAFLAGRRVNPLIIWKILQYQIWYKQWMTQ